MGTLVVVKPHQIKNAQPATRWQILLVEDEPAYQQAIASALGQLTSGCGLRICGQGADALREVRNTAAKFDIIIIDLGLPDMCGLSVVREASVLRPQTPIMVASIHSDETHVLNAISAGARGYLLKDDNALDISTSVERMIGGEYPISPSLARYLFKLAKPPPSSLVPANEFRLSPKELELLALLARGHPYKRAALLMGVTLSTVQTYVRRTYQKLEAHSKVEAIGRARALGLLG